MCESPGREVSRFGGRGAGSEKSLLKLQSLQNLGFQGKIHGYGA